MAVSSSAVVTYESREIIVADSTRSSALFQITTTTTVRTAPDTPVGTSVSETASFLSIDYTPVYTDIANSAEAIKNTLQNIETLAAGSGIHTSTAFDWLGLMSIYKHYVDNPDTAIGLEELRAYKAKIDDLPKSF
jgi:hypothetical protein